MARLDWAEENEVALPPEDRHFGDRLRALVDAVHRVLAQLTGA
jgi:hypothetical protein